MSTQICYQCGVLGRHPKGQCIDCLENSKSHFWIGEQRHTHQQICDDIMQNKRSPFDIISTDIDAKGHAINSDIRFSSFFLRKYSQAHKPMKKPTASTSKIIDKQPPLKHNKSHDIRKDIPIQPYRKSRVWMILILAIGLMASLYMVQENRFIMEQHYFRDPKTPSSFLSYLDANPEGGTSGSQIFPNQGELHEQAAIVSENENQLVPQEVGELLLLLALQNKKAPRAMGSWVDWALAAYPNDDSVLAAKSWWLWRHGESSESCDYASRCAHDACIAIDAFCNKRYRVNFNRNPYHVRVHFEKWIENRGAAIDFISHLPSFVQFAVQGDVALMESDYDKALSYYKKAQKEGNNVEEELMRTANLLGDYTYTLSFPAKTAAEKRLQVRALIENRKLDKADALAASLDDKRSEFQKQYIRYLKGSLSSDFIKCVPKTIEEKVFCAQIYIHQGMKAQALNLVENLSHGDPAKTMVELLLALEENDSINIETALKNFAFGQPKLLLEQAPENADIPRIPLDDISQQLKKNKMREELVHLAIWLLSALQDKNVSKNHFATTSGASCFAALQNALSLRDWKEAEDQLGCLSHIQFDSNTMKFYNIYVSQKSSKITTKSFEQLLPAKPPRTLLYWVRQTITSPKNRMGYHQKITGSNPRYYGFSSRWKQLQYE